MYSLDSMSTLKNLCDSKHWRRYEDAWPFLWYTKQSHHSTLFLGSEPCKLQFDNTLKLWVVPMTWIGIHTSSFWIRRSITSFQRHIDCGSGSKWWASRSLSGFILHIRRNCWFQAHFYENIHHVQTPWNQISKQNPTPHSSSIWRCGSLVSEPSQRWDHFIQTRILRNPNLLHIQLSGASDGMCSDEVPDIFVLKQRFAGRGTKSWIQLWFCHTTFCIHTYHKILFFNELILCDMEKNIFVKISWYKKNQNCMK